MSRIYEAIFFDNEVNIKTATIREDIVVSNTITVANSTLTANTIDTVSNTQTLIQTINETSASDPNLGIRYDSLVIDSGQPDVSNIASNIVARALLAYTPTGGNNSNGGSISSNSIVVSNLVANALEALNLSADDVLVSNIDATTIEAGNVVVDYLQGGEVHASNLYANVLTVDPYILVNTGNGIALCHRSNTAPTDQSATSGYNVLALFADEA